MPRKALVAVLVSAVMILSVVVSMGMLPGVGAAAPPVATPATTTVTPSAVASPVSTPAAASSSVSTTPVSLVNPASVDCSSLQTTANDPAYATWVQHVKTIGSDALSAGLPRSDLHLPYAGAIPDQVVNGVPTPGDLLTSECAAGNNTDAPEPTGVAYDGVIDQAGTVHQTIDSDSVEGILTVNSTNSFYPNSGTPTQWGGQLNVVMPNVTILGQKCASPVGGVCSSPYAFWIQNVISYDVFNQTISFVDDTWNFTSGSAEMIPSSLVSWSPNGGSYTGVWVAFSPYIYCPPPFTVTAYVNTSVNSAGDQVLWYNYSVLTNGHFYANGNYDYLVFNSQPPTGGPIAMTPPYFEASATTHHEVTEGYEFDAFIGADDGAGNLDLSANATMQVKYCSLAPSNYCTPTNFKYANVPAAVNFGSQTGEQTVGIAVNYIGAVAYLSGGPEIEHGLWNYTAQAGNAVGNTKVLNAITVSGAPLAPLPAQPYVFVFMENAAIVSQGYQWAPDVPAWYLMPGTYYYELMLADYAEQFGTIVVGLTTTTLTATLPYSTASGVYTPLWAFNNAQLAGISTSGTGTAGNQYALFNNPTTAVCTLCGNVTTANNLSAVFYSSNDYTFSSFSGLFLDGTTAYVYANNMPTFCAHTSGSTYYYLNVEFFETSHVTLAHDSELRGWPAWTEISFYATVPASQNPAPQATVFVWNSTNDLIMSNMFVGVAPSGGHVAATELVMYGGGNNVVWGNTFRDPYNVAIGASYAGIEMAESGDLIYNNNFTVDNPVVYAPYNWANVADCLPQSLGGCGNNLNNNGWYYNHPTDTWNVATQPASNVVNTINGFPLSGNVLGPSVTTQGGNYFWNYGTSPNNYTTSPYVDRFLYTDWSIIYPLGCGTNPPPGAPCATAPPVVAAYQNGMNGGTGDFAPYGPTVTFSETGLSLGGSWAINLNGRLTVTTSSSVTLTIPYGTYSYSVAAIGSSLVPTPASGTVLASGVPVVNVAFSVSAPTYSVYFTASGIFSGTSFSVSFNGGGAVSSGGTSQVIFNSVAAGSYPYVVTAPTGYTLVSSTPSSPLTVSSSSVSVALVFTPTTYTVTFTETGLPSGTVWGLSFGGVFHWGTAGSGASSITFQVAGSVGGTLYNWLIGYIAGYPSSPSSGSTTVFTSNPGTISITFT